MVFKKGISETKKDFQKKYSLCQKYNPQEDKIELIPLRVIIIASNFKSKLHKIHEIKRKLQRHLNTHYPVFDQLEQ